MIRTPALAAQSLLLLASLAPAFAAPPGRGECFNGGAHVNGCVPANCAAFTSCGEDDTGCVSNSTNHTHCAVAIGKAFAKAVAGTIKCHEKQTNARFKGAPAAVAAGIAEMCEVGPSGKS